MGIVNVYILYYIHVLWDMQKKSNYNTYTKFEYRIIIPFQNSLPGISDYLGVMLVSTCPHHPQHHCPTTDLHVSTQPLQRWDSTGTKAMIGEYWERLRKNSCSYTIFFWRGAWFIPSIVGKWTCEILIDFGQASHRSNQNHPLESIYKWTTDTVNYGGFLLTISLGFSP